MTYKEAAKLQKEWCDKGKHWHSVSHGNDYYVLERPSSDQWKYECCPCFGCCVPEMRNTVQ